MKNTLEKASQLTLAFLSNFSSEIEKNPDLKKNLSILKDKLWGNPPTKLVYRSLQLADNLIINSLKSYCPAPRGSTAIDRFMEKTFYIPQYYGGIREFYGNSFYNKLLLPFSRLTDLVVYKNFKVLRKIEDQDIPRIFKRLFNYEELENVTKETEESLKQLANQIFDNEPEWKKKEIILDDIRLVETESVKMKNLKKTIKCDFELSTVLTGIQNKKKRHLRRVFGCSFNFINEFGEWVASNFSFTPFD